MATETVRLIETRHEAGQVLRRHRHERGFVTLVLDGGYEEYRAGRTDDCKSGVAVLHRNGEEHEDRFGDRRTRLLNLEIDDRVLDGLSGDRVLSGPAIRRLAGRLDHELSIRDSASSLVLDSVAAELVALDSMPADSFAPAWFSRVVERIRSEFLESLSLADLAKEAGVHKSHLAREFRRRMGMTSGELVRRLRVEWAKVRLLQGVEPVVVAVEASFADQSHFHKWFKRLTGMTPGAWATSGATGRGERVTPSLLQDEARGGERVKPSLFAL